jgi:transcriptional regulator with PAS, ATPase and Fis domain
MELLFVESDGLGALGRIVGDSDATATLRARIARIAQLNVPVLITGETGTGKELVARSIHECSPRRKHPFVGVNCGALSDSLLESELFGHEKGAFTGAVAKRRGFFEEAGHGTILLDEIGEISPRVQVSLLRVLETEEFLPVGASQPRKLYCRIMAATNANLDNLSQNKLFRLDLLFRPRRLTVFLQPLRCRPLDILPLARHFLTKDGGEGQTLAPELEQHLLDRKWAGNVRELHHIIEQMQLIAGPKSVFTIADLDDPYTEGRSLSTSAESTSTPTSNTQPSGQQAAPGNEMQGSYDSFANTLAAGKSRLRRLERLRKLFKEHRVLTRSELIALIKVAPNTLTRDLQILCSEGYICRKEPTPSPRTFFFELRA